MKFRVVRQQRNAIAFCPAPDTAVVGNDSRELVTSAQASFRAMTEERFIANEQGGQRGSHGQFQRCNSEVQ
jgi:hypothetical protein